MFVWALYTYNISFHEKVGIKLHAMSAKILYEAEGKLEEKLGSYMHITITNPIEILTDTLHFVRNTRYNCITDNSLQKGFTQGSIPLVAALILTKINTEAKETRDPRNIALIDAESALGVVWHDRHLHKLIKLSFVATI